MYKTYQDNYEEEKTSKYNAAVSQIYRLDALWQECHYHRKRGNLKAWNVRLDCIYTELADDAKLEEETAFFNFMGMVVKYQKNKIILNQVLMKKEIFLRKLQNRQGKGTAYKDESEDDFE